jgi:glycosyltransferase involved in cell wall biosynthesis
MLTTRIYYAFKPFVPRPLRIAMRRWSSNRLRAQRASEWPILESAGAPPENWGGWPDGKRFAFTLTHDVEGSSGLAKVKRLAALEKELGFRSAFHFIPEGEYRVSAELRQELCAGGFEVGVHDLHHDGKLFSSREEFRSKAQRINGYLKEWNATGFRAGFMLHNLSWIGDLDVQYDLSTFDTDPFEPQPDGAGTIFPFWVPRLRDRQGYIELPYTLAQDSTLFFLLKEKTIDIWKKKLDWIVSRGGMALLNVHPDYVDFEGNGEPNKTFPSALYREFLQYVRSRYDGQFWEALPRDIAKHVQPMRPLRPRKSRRVCMVSYSYYDADNRVRRYAESLARRGDSVEIVSIRNESDPEGPQMMCGVTVHGLQKRVRDEKGPLSYLTRLVRFCVSASAFVARQHRKQPYDLIHVHNMPDFLTLTAWWPRLSGAKVILDIHDIVPELYASKFKVDENRPVIRALKKVEAFCAKGADHVIISNHLWFDKLTARSAPKEKCSVFVNHVDPAIFYRRERKRNDGKFIIVFPGGLQWHQGVDLAIRALGLLRDKIPNAEFHIYGGGHCRPDLEALAKELNLSDRVLFHGGRPIDQIADIVANSDLGVVPKRADGFGNEAYSTKIMEFMSQGVPVVLSRTRIDAFYFTDAEVRFFESGNVEALADAILTVARNQTLRESMVKNAFDYVAKNSWAVKEVEYLNLVDSLTA